MKQVNAMTDEELQQVGVSHQRVSGAAPSEWPYYDETDVRIPPNTTYPVTEK